MEEIKLNKYLSATSIYEDAAKRLDELSAIKTQIEKQLTKAPEGKIHIIHKNKRVQYYIRKDPKDKSGTYLSKKNIKKVSTYLQKKYNIEILASINKEILILENLLKQAASLSSNIINIYSNNPDEIQKLISPIAIPDYKYGIEWLSIPYKPKDVCEGETIYETDNKELVRSKSELNIANMLKKMNVPYKYECPIMLKNGWIIHPDFTVLNVKNRKVYYWEHRGKMADPDYANDSVHRLKLMAKSGIVIGDNLLITEETLKHPLGTNEIELIIKRFFL